MSLKPLINSALIVAVSAVTVYYVGGAIMARLYGGDMGMMGGMPPAMVSTMKVEVAPAPIEFDYVGQVSGSREVEVRSRVTGIIEERLYEEGARVEKDAILFRIDPASYKAATALAEADVAQARARLKQASRDFERIQPLAKTEAASRKELDDVQSALDYAKAAVKGAEARLNQASIDLGYTNVKAPITGMAGRALKVEGSLAAAPADSLLTTMAVTDPVYVNFSISEGEQLKLRKDVADGKVQMPEGGFQVLLKTSDGADIPVQGQLDFNDYKSDVATGTFAARSTIANPNGTLAPGQFVRVHLTGATRLAVATVPQRAVMDSPAGKFVYTLGHDDKGGTIALPRPIKVGDWVKTTLGKNGWVIEEGLMAGDEIIIDGMARIFFPGAPVVVVPPGGMPAPQMGGGH